MSAAGPLPRRSRLSRTMLPGLALVLLPGLADAACGDSLPAAGRQYAEGEQMRVAFTPRVWPIPVGRHFAVDIELCAPPPGDSAAQLRVDADMPAHKHGMNYRTTVKLLAPGRYVAEGLMFHMPGRWRFVFDLRGSPQTGTATSTIDIQ